MTTKQAVDDKPTPVELTTEEIALVFMALQDLQEHFRDEWPDDLKRAVEKVCGVIERLGPVSSVAPFTIRLAE